MIICRAVAAVMLLGALSGAAPAVARPVRHACHPAAPARFDGAWQAGSIEALGDFKPPALLPPLPRPGSMFRISGAKLCFGPADCSDFTTSRQRLTDGPGQEKLPALLGLPADAPFHAVTLNDRAAFGLVRLPNGDAAAISTACDATGDHCGFVREIWRRSGQIVPRQSPPRAP